MAPAAAAHSGPLSSSRPGVDCGGAGVADDVVDVKDGASLVAALEAGDRGVRLQGDLDEPITIAVSGEAGNPVVVDLGGARVTAPIVVEGAKHVVVRGGVFISDGSFSWITARDVVDFVVVDSAFDVSCFGCGDAFPGIDIDGGADLRMCGNAFGSWIGDAVWLRNIDRMLVDQNDFGRAQGEHSLLSFLGVDLVVRDNVFRNPWDRVLHIASLEPAVVTRRAVIEHNVFLDSDWDRKRFRPVDDTFADGGGALEAIRMLGNDHIFRGNLVVSTRRGNEGECHGGLVLTTFSTALWSIEQVQGNRVYNNVFVGNDAVGIGVLDHLERGLIADNIVAQNVFADSVDAAVGLCSERRSADELTVRDNLFDRGGAVAVVTDEGVVTDVDIADDAPGFVGNVEADVVFADRAIVDAAVADLDGLSLAGAPPLFAGLQVEDAPAGAPLTHVVERQGNRVVVLEDAAFFSDGRGVVDGDVVIVGDDPATQTAQIESIEGNVVTFTADLAEVEAGVGVRWARSPGAPLARPAP